MKDENDKQPFRAYYQSLIGVTLSSVELQPSQLVIRKSHLPTILDDPKVMKVELYLRTIDIIM